MDQDRPEWLNVDFLNQCIRSKERFKQMTTTSFTSESAVPPGNNYGSYILRVKAKIQDQTVAGKSEQSLSLIIKCPLTSGTIKELFNEVLVSEPIFYNEFLPLGHQLLSRSFTAEHFKSPISAVVVLEDLKEKGFVMAEKLEQLDFEQCRLYMSAAANFHAMSVGVYKRDKSFNIRIDKEKIFSNDLGEVATTSNKNMLMYCLDSLANHVSEFLPDSRIPGIIRNCSPIFWDLMVQAMAPNETFNTLNQGDPWLTNMMFVRDNDGKACDIKLLDFQCLRYASPISDVMFLLWTSANYDVLKNHQNALFEIYLESLNNALEEMEIEEKLSMTTLKEHVLQQSPVALYGVALCRPMIMKSSFTDMDVMYKKCKGEFRLDNNPYEVLYTESFCKIHLPPLVEYLDKSGIFDYIESKLGKAK